MNHPATPTTPLPGLKEHSTDFYQFLRLKIQNHCTFPPEFRPLHFLRNISVMYPLAALHFVCCVTFKCCGLMQLCKIKKSLSFDVFINKQPNQPPHPAPHPQHKHTQIIFFHSVVTSFLDNQIHVSQETQHGATS